MSFDIASLDTRTKSEAGVEMPIMHPRTRAPIIDQESGKQVTITLLGRNSDKFRVLQREMTARRAAFASRGVVMNDEDYDRERQDIVGGCTVGWSFSTMDGEPFPFNTENVRRLWADRRWSWLLGEAFAFLTEEGNFLAL